MRTFLAMALAATLLSPVAASAQALEPPVQPKLNLTLQDRYTIKELIKDVRVTPAPGKQAKGESKPTGRTEVRKGFDDTGDRPHAIAIASFSVKSSTHPATQTAPSIPAGANNRLSS